MRGSICNTALRQLRTVSRQNLTRFHSTTSNNFKSNSSKYIIGFATLSFAGFYLSQKSKIDLDADKQKFEEQNNDILATFDKEATIIEEAENLKKRSEESITYIEEEESKDAAAETETEGESDPKQQAAYNPETGEINWDCPCLGGMAHGPCGEEFKEAFACFVYSETDPKGIDCIKKFENMRTCFRKYPDIYEAELADDDDDYEQSEPVVTATETIIVSDSDDEPVIIEVSEIDIPVSFENETEQKNEA